VPLVSRERWRWQDRSLETILLIILPYLALLVGFWVAIVRPRDPRAWLVLAITGSYLGIGNAGFDQWPPYVRDVAVAFHGAVVNAFPIWLLLFGINFPEPFPDTDKLSKWQWMKWILIIPLALAAILFAVQLVGEMESYASVAFMERVPHILAIGAINIYF